MPETSVVEQLIHITYLKIAFLETEIETYFFTTLLYPTATTKYQWKLLSVWSFCIGAKVVERQKHSIPLDPIFGLSMQTNIRGMKSPVSCAGLDRITIKGSKSVEPIPFAANRMSKCFSLCSPLWVLVKTAKWCCASSEDPKPSFHFIVVRANEKRTWKTMTKTSVRRRRKCRKWSESGKCVRCSLVCLMRAECSQALSRLKCCGLIITRVKTGRGRNAQSGLVHHLHQRPDAWSSVTVGQIRATEVWAQMWRAETGAWSIATYVEQCRDAGAEGLSRGTHSPRGTFAVCPITRQQIKTLIGKQGWC